MIAIHTAKGIVYDWENSLTTPKFLSYAEEKHIHWKYPVKFFDSPYENAWYTGSEKMVVRVDAYPLLWIYILLAARMNAIAENLLRKFLSRFMRLCNKAGIAKTPKFCDPSIKDFFRWIKITKFQDYRTKHSKTKCWEICIGLYWAFVQIDPWQEWFGNLFRYPILDLKLGVLNFGFVSMSWGKNVEPLKFPIAGLHNFITKDDD
jgi:hypothetical protein